LDLLLLRGFSSIRGVFTAINVPGETRATDARGINERGTIVGSYATEPVLGRNVGHAYVLDDGIFTSFDVPGLEGPTAYDINNRGVIVGTGSDLTPALASHGFILEDGVFTILDFPGATLTEALGINDRGQIVGVARIGSPARDTGFLFDRGVFTTIDVPGALSSLAYDINNRGQIVGIYMDTRYTGGGCAATHGFLAIPVTFPPSLLLFGAATVVLLAIRTRPFLPRQDHPR